MNVILRRSIRISSRKKSGDRGNWLDDFYPILLNSFRYDGEHIGQGPIYGLPAKDCTTCVMYVNVDLFKQAGIEVPYGGWTWDEYETACRKITDLSTKNRSIFGGVIESWPGVLRNTMWTFGAEFFSDDFRQTLFGTPAAQRAMGMIRRLRFDDKTVFNATSGSSDQGGQEFFSGDIGIWGPVGRWKTPRLRSGRAQDRAGRSRQGPFHVGRGAGAA